MNLAALWHLPVLFCCENNGYAMGTALDRSESETNLCAKAASYRIPAQPVDGMDVVAVREATAAAAAEVRAGHGPQFLEFRTYRFRAHSMFDPDLYRPKAEVEEWKKRGPLHTFTDRLKAQALFTEADFAELEREVADELKASIAFAEGSAWEPAERLTMDVCAPEPPA
jgi:pyruvate dehydrogenase E1 component alpha subunit